MTTETYRKTQPALLTISSIRPCASLGIASLGFWKPDARPSRFRTKADASSRVRSSILKARIVASGVTEDIPRPAADVNINARGRVEHLDRVNKTFVAAVNFNKAVDKERASLKKPFLAIFARLKERHASYSMFQLGAMEGIFLLNIRQSAPTHRRGQTWRALWEPIETLPQHAEQLAR